MINDANDILGNKNREKNKKQSVLLNKSLTDVEKKSNKKSDSNFKRPNGMHRELFNLLVHQGKDNNIHSLMPTTTKKGYTSAKAKLGLRKTRKWFWKKFINAGRTDGLQLFHWEREDQVDKIYPFAKLNKFVQPVSFTDEEYEKYLTDSYWSLNETRHLLLLCHRFDLRWPIVEDRFDQTLSKNKKCMEDLKERYYFIINSLKLAQNKKSNINLLNGNDLQLNVTETVTNNDNSTNNMLNKQKLFGYDAEHEKRRKEQLKKLWNRTKEQVKEEEELKIALKRIETKRKEREKKAYDLQRLINATDQTSLSPDSNNTGGGGSPGAKANRLQRKLKTKTVQAAAQQLTAPSDSLSIRYHEFRSAGPHLRSQEMKLPSNIGQKKKKNIDTVIEKLKLDLIPHGMEEIVELYNTFRSNIVILQDLKTALHAAETTLETLCARIKSEKKTNINIEPRMRVSDNLLDIGSDIMLSPTRNLRAKGPGVPSSLRRITSWIDVNPAGLSSARKRKTRQFSPSENESPVAIRTRY